MMLTLLFVLIAILVLLSVRQDWRTVIRYREDRCEQLRSIMIAKAVQHVGNFEHQNA